MSTETKVTYVSLASSPEFHEAFERALAEVEAGFGGLVPCSIGGEPSAAGRTREVRSPIDRRVVLGEVEQAAAAEAARAVELAHGAWPAWRRLGWKRRVALLRRAADLLSERRLALAALMAWEVGKNRIEATAEVEESADLLRYYCDQMEKNDGYRMAMARVSPDEATESVCLPYGVWGVVSPFNFPSALAAGMVAGALVTGNTVVLKPSQDAPLSGAHLCRALWDAGVPRDVLHLVMGGGEEVGEAILGHPLTSGMAFTGSWEVGMRIQRTFSRDWPKPVVVEMGGKNPTVVTAAADLDAAATAVARAAFGFGGQKCSACSRAYVERAVAEEFTGKLVAAARGLTVGNPLRQETFLGPLIHQRAVDSFTRYVEGVRAAGGEILAGGHVLTEGDLAHGHYVEPTVAALPDPCHPYFTEEMFVPLLLVHPVADLDEALALCNRAPYGLTAGLFSRDPAEVERFLDGIEAGVTYINRKSGSTTGAWPGVNPFGGWKASGGTGPAALGPNYLLRFLREQSRTVSDVDEEILDDEDMVGYENSKSTLEFLRALAHRGNHLRASRADLAALATAGERILETDALSQRPILSSYTIRASIIVMICATIEGILMDLGAEAKKTEGLTLGPMDLRGSSLESAKAFFKKVAQLRFPAETTTWSKLKNLFDLRHAIAHQWGRIKGEPRRRAVEALGVVVSETGEVILDAATVSKALDIMQSFTDELESYLGGDQKPTEGG